MVRRIKSTLFLACALMCAGAQAQTIFRIGKPDASAAEFNDFGVDFNSTRYYYPHGTDPYKPTREFFSKEIVFNAGKDPDSKFPFVLPMRACEWADPSWLRPLPDENFYSAPSMIYRDFKKIKFHPLTIKFDLKELPDTDLYLRIGLVDKAPYFVNDQFFSVSVNSNAPVEVQQPYMYKRGQMRPCFSSLIMYPKTWGIPKTATVKIKKEWLKAGENSISIEAVPSKTLKSTALPQWVAFDYLELSASGKAPKVENPYEAERKKMLSSLDFDEIVFTMRGSSLDAHWYGNFGRYPDPYKGYTKENSPLNYLKYSAQAGMLAIDPKDARTDSCVFPKNGGKLVKFNIKTGEISQYISDPEGGVRNVCVDYDADKMLYSYRKGGQDQYYMYESKIDGTGAKLMPFSGTQFDDVEGSYLPNGDVVFVSSRCQRTVPCWMVDVAVLHRWYAQEGLLRQISANVDQDNTPWPTSDGRLIYMKWEYVQKSQLNFHGLWKKDPNGANDMVFFGNDIPWGLLIDAKPFEGSNRYAFAYATYHGRRDHQGQIAVIDNPKNPGDYKAMKFLSEDSITALYSTPYPLNDKYVLASQDQKLYVFDLDGHVFELPLPDSFKPFKDTIIFDAQPVRKRAKPQMPADMADYDTKEATVVVVDASIGRNMQGVKPSDIKKLMVLEVLPNITHLFGGSEPISMRGTFSFERCLGTVEVEDDGSAHFKVPANRALSFVALDKDGRAIKRMQSFTSFINGTTTSCIGCHEMRDMAPPPIKNKLKALRRSADSIKPIDGISPRDVIDFVRDIQPILNRHCAQCHNPQKFAAKIDLSDGMGPMFPTAYYYLRMRRQIRDGEDRDGNLPPYTFGSGGSRIMKKIGGEHKNVKLDEREMETMKRWLDMGSTAAQSCACIESGMFGYYYSNILLRPDKDWPEMPRMKAAFDRRCLDCHKGDRRLPSSITNSGDVDAWRFYWDNPPSSPRIRLSNHAAFNLKHPQLSSVLMAPLSRKAGGRAADGAHPVVFKSKDDPDYRIILSAIQRASDYVKNENPRYTDKNYKPRGAYYSALLRRGIITEETPLENFDAFEADKKYWDKVIDPPAQSFPKK